MAYHPERVRHPPEKWPVELGPIQRALQENEDWNRDLVEHSQDLLCIHDLQGRLLSVNPAPARVLGYSVEELLQIPMREIIAPEHRHEFNHYLNQVRQTGESRGLMVVVTRAGERRIWDYHNTLRTEGIASPIVRGMAHDVTERIRHEKRLQEYERVVEGLDEMIVVVDRQYRYLIANRAFLQYRKMEREQVIGHRVDEIVGKEVFETLIKGKMDECFEGKLVRYELRYRFPNLGERDLLASYFPIEGRSGVDRLAFILQDITERKQAEEELRVAREKLAEEKDYLEEEIDTELGFGEIIGQSKALRGVLEQVAKVAATDATVLILGETGTGKELIARAIHRMSRRQGNAFIKMNCAAIPSGLLESELFGHERGPSRVPLPRKLAVWNSRTGAHCF
jgi:PAS domain S-box-containing protein